MRSRGKNSSVYKARLRIKESSSQDFARTLEEVYYTFLKKSNNPVFAGPRPATTDNSENTPKLNNLPVPKVNRSQLLPAANRLQPPSTANQLQPRENGIEWAKTRDSARDTLFSVMPTFAGPLNPEHRLRFLTPHDDQQLQENVPKLMSIGNELGRAERARFSSPPMQRAALHDALFILSAPEEERNALIQEAQRRLGYLTWGEDSSRQSRADFLNAATNELLGVLPSDAFRDQDVRNKILESVSRFSGANTRHYLRTYHHFVPQGELSDLKKLYLDENVLRLSAEKDMYDRIAEWASELRNKGQTANLQDINEFLNSQLYRTIDTPQTRYYSGAMHEDEMAARMETTREEVHQELLGELQKTRQRLSDPSLSPEQIQALQQQEEQIVQRLAPFYQQPDDQYPQPPPQQQQLPQQQPAGGEAQSGATTQSAAFNWNNISDFHKSLVMGGILMSLLGGAGGLGGFGPGASVPLVLGLGAALYGLTGGDLSKIFRQEFWSGLFGGFSGSGQAGQAQPQTGNPAPGPQTVSVNVPQPRGNIWSIASKVPSLLANPKLMSEITSLLSDARQGRSKPTELLQAYFNLKKQHPQFADLVNEVVAYVRANPGAKDWIMKNLQGQYKDALEAVLTIEELLNR